MAAAIYGVRLRDALAREGLEPGHYNQIWLKEPRSGEWDARWRRRTTMVREVREKGEGKEASRAGYNLAAGRP